jgi:hypothetical protein
LDAAVSPAATSSQVNDLVNEALKRWLALTGLVFDKRGDVKASAENCPWQRYHLGELTRGLNESRDLDPTGLTTFMMLRGMVESYLRAITYSAEALILNASSIEAQLAPMRAVRDVLEHPDVLALIADFQNQLRQAALHYGVPQGKPMEALETFLLDKYDLAIVRRDALLSARRLDAHQFSQGKPDVTPPKYSENIYEFWNVNSLLAAMRAQKFGGISVVLIRDPVEALNSYFIFAIRNGTTFTILTDREKGPHPAYERMSRRPDRDLERRAARNWFPYELLNLKRTDGRDERLYATAREQLVPLNVEGVPLKPIGQLHAEEFVWTTLMFDFIRDRFWNKNERLPELSYTGQMVAEPQALVGAHGALVRDGAYKPLELPALTRKDVTADTTKSQWETKPTAFNRWIVERYAHLVPEEVFNVVGAQARNLLEAKAEELLAATKAMKKHSHKEDPTFGFETLSPVSFGVKKEIQRDRLWVARVNQMKAIQVLADGEYEREKDSIARWYEAAIRKNRELLLDAAARGTLKLPTWRNKSGGFSPKVLAKGEALSQAEGKDWDKAHTVWHFRKPEFHLGSERSSVVPSRRWRHRPRTISHATCAERPEVRATIFTLVEVTCPQALAIVCGVTVDELPWPLQHWYDDAPYYGNNILTRLDPEDWALQNPWMPNAHRVTGLRLDIGITHCKNALNARRKALGLPPKVFHEKESDK